MEFQDWLENTVKLPKCLKYFEKEALADLSMIKMLNDRDLEKIGIRKMGHRMILLQHIAHLNQTKMTK